MVIYYYGSTMVLRWLLIWYSHFGDGDIMVVWFLWLLLLYYVILWIIMLYYVILCSIMLYYVILCSIMLYYVLLCYYDCDIVMVLWFFKIVILMVRLLWWLNTMVIMMTYEYDGYTTWCAIPGKNMVIIWWWYTIWLWLWMRWNCGMIWIPCNCCYNGVFLVSMNMVIICLYNSILWVVVCGFGNEKISHSCCFLHPHENDWKWFDIPLVVI